MSKPIHEIEEAAVDAAVANLKAIRPDLQGQQTLALARMVAKDAVAEVVKGLRDNNHIGGTDLLSDISKLLQGDGKADPTGMFVNMLRTLQKRD